jgi:hypothetical protein
MARGEPEPHGSAEVEQVHGEPLEAQQLDEARNGVCQVVKRVGERESV